MAAIKRRRANNDYLRDGVVLTKIYFQNDSDKTTRKYKDDGLTGYVAELVAKHVAVKGHHVFTSTEIEAWVKRNYPHLNRKDVTLVNLACRMDREITSLDDFILVPNGPMESALKVFPRGDISPYTFKDERGYYRLNKTNIVGSMYHGDDRWECHAHGMGYFIRHLEDLLFVMELTPHARQGLTEFIDYLCALREKKQFWTSRIHRYAAIKHQLKAL
ncbi:hypothetical protein CZP2022_8 [Vibrio phage C-ZP2022]|nr:hypothetical protein CZP2022_8 [Vibrio phage C-ZP2022]